MQFNAAARARRELGLACGLFAVAVGAAPPALAHHSYAMFDAAKTIEVQGAVKRFLWTNPHSLLVVAVRNPAGEVVDYSFEANGPGYLVRNGWKRESLKPGDMVTVASHPLRDGTLGGDIVEVTFADGHKLSARITVPGATK